MAVERFWDLNDFINARDSFQAQNGFHYRSIIFMKFNTYQTENADRPGIEQYQSATYYTTRKTCWLSQVKVFDTVKGGYFTTGDLDVNSSFKITGYSPGYVLPNGTLVPEYAGDQIIWNGKVWVVSDQIEPVQAGTQAPATFYRTVLRRLERQGAAVVGP